MTRLLIIEPAFHHEVLQTYIEIFSGICHLKVMTSMETWRFVHPDAQRLIESDSLLLSASIDKFNKVIALNSDFISKNDVSLVITQESQYGEIINPRPLVKPILLVHSLYYTFAPAQHLYPFNFTDLPRTFSRIIRHVFRSNARKCLKDYSAYMVTSKNYFDFASKSGLAVKPLYVLPMYYAKGLQRQNADNGKKRIVIHGTVDENVRNYHIVARALSMLSQIEKQSIELILLGKLKHNNHLVPSYFEDAGVDVMYFEGTIDATSYESELLKADFLILPLLEKVREGITYALSSMTNTSGTIADAQKYFIPVIIPDYIELDLPLKRISFKYNSVVTLYEAIKTFLYSESPSVEYPQHDLNYRKKQATKILNEILLK